MQKRKYFVAILAALLTGASVHGGIILNDTFDDLDRTNQALPGSAQWFIATNNAVMTTSFSASTGALGFTLPATGTAATELAYFADASNPISLAVGESLNVTATVNLPVVANSARGFRLGLFNSAGSRLTGDTVQNPTATDPSVGYTFDVNPSTLATQLTKRRTPNVAQVLFGGTVSNLGTPTASGGTALVAGTAFPISITIARDSSGILLTGVINGNTFSASDLNPGASTGIFTSFDTFAFFQASALNSSAGSPQLSFDNVVVTYNAIPEPSLLSVVALGGMALVRRRRA